MSLAALVGCWNKENVILLVICFVLSIIRKSKDIMNILNMAKYLNAVETLYVENNVPAKYNAQDFDYLLVLDFEATCWDMKDIHKKAPEIIEFPCILFDIQKCVNVAEFQQYVMPTENHKLSSFCTQLTGIKQYQVDNGVPLGTALMLFQQWLKEFINCYNLTFETSPLSYKKCTFATWSDWDLGVCLRNECKRKRIKIADMFNRWIDVRALYREHYLRKPKGLHGAIKEVGLEFEGKEHCGLDDARNTAKLIGRMVADGVLLKITTEN